MTMLSTARVLAFFARASIGADWLAVTWSHPLLQRMCSHPPSFLLTSIGDLHKSQNSLLLNIRTSSFHLRTTHFPKALYIQTCTLRSFLHQKATTVNIFIQNCSYILLYNINHIYLTIYCAVFWTSRDIPVSKVNGCCSVFGSRQDKNISLRQHCLQTRCGIQPSSHPVSTWDKATGARNQPFITVWFLD